MLIITALEHFVHKVVSSILYQLTPSCVTIKRSREVEVTMLLQGFCVSVALFSFMVVLPVVFVLLVLSVLLVCFSILWLVLCQHQPVASYPQPHSDAVQVIDSSGQGDSIRFNRNEMHYAFLLHLSERLSREEVEKLMYVCGIPKSLWPELKAGFYVFSELEIRGDLKPGKYCYLANRLQVIGRLDLAGPMRNPDCQFQLISIVWEQKRLKFKTNRIALAEYTRAVGEPKLEETLNDILGGLTLAWRMDRPGCSWRLDLDGLDRSVSDTLKATFAYVLEKLKMYPLPDFQKMKRPLEECKKYYNQFSEAADRMEWNKKLRDRCMRKTCSHIEPATFMYAYIKEASTFVLEQSMTCETIEVANSQSSLLETHFRTGWQFVVLISWLIYLCQQHMDKEYDLKEQVELLWDIISAQAHKENINRIRHIVLPIVGPKVMNEVGRLLGPPTTTEPEICQPIWTIKAVAWYVLLLELYGLSAGCNINPREIAERYLDVFGKYKLIVVEHYVRSRKKAIKQIEHGFSEGLQTLRGLPQSSEKLAVLLPELCD